MSSSRQNQYQKGIDSSNSFYNNSNKTLADCRNLFQVGHYSRKSVELLLNLMMREDPGYGILENRTLDKVQQDVLVRHRRVTINVINDLVCAKPHWMLYYDHHDDNDDLSTVTMEGDIRSVHDDDVIVKDHASMSSNPSNASLSDLKGVKHMVHPVEYEYTLTDELEADLHQKISDLKGNKSLSDADKLLNEDKLKKAMKRQIHITMSSYHTRYNAFISLEQKRLENGIREEKNIVDNYKNLSTSGKAIINSVMTTSLKEKLHAREDYQKAASLPCIMGVFQAFLHTLKDAAGDPTAKRKDEMKRLLDFKMKPMESAASYSVRYTDQLVNCLDVNLTLDKHDCLAGAVDGLTDEYDGFRLQLQDERLRDWKTRWSLPELWKQLLRFEEEFVLPKRTRGRETTISHAAVTKRHQTPKSPTKSDGPTNTIGYCFLYARDGVCTRSGCTRDHSNLEAAKTAFRSYMATHKCDRANNSCTPTSCYWMRGMPTKEATGNKTDSVFLSKKAISDPFRNAICAEVSLPDTPIVMKAKLDTRSNTKLTRDLYHVPHDHWSVAMLDSGTNKVLFKTLDFLEHVTECDTHATIASANTQSGTLKVTHKGALPGLMHDIPVLVSPDITANLIGEDVLDEHNWEICASEPGNQCRIIRHRDTGQCLKLASKHDSMDG